MITDEYQSKSDKIKQPELLMNILVLHRNHNG